MLIERKRIYTNSACESKEPHVLWFRTVFAWQITGRYDSEFQLTNTALE